MEAQSPVNVRAWQEAELHLYSRMSGHKWNRNSIRYLLPLQCIGVATVAVLLTFFFALPPSFHAQQQPGAIESLPVQETLSVDVDLVTVPFTVVDEHGRSVSRLTGEVFKVYENGQPQTIVSFGATKQGQIASIALLIDSSYSVSRSLEVEKIAAARFFRLLLHSGDNRALVATFNTDIDLLEDYTSDAELLTRRIQKIHANGATRLIDAIDAVIDRKLAREDGQRVIVIISDGDDNLSRIPLSAVIEKAQRYDVSIYALRVESVLAHLSTPILLPYLDPLHGTAILKELTEKTGGAMFPAEKPNDFATALKHIASTLQSRYSIQYQSNNSNLNDGYRHIRIEIANAKYHVHCREGYFPPPPPAALSGR
jgi:VWFA-related protein